MRSLAIAVLFLLGCSVAVAQTIRDGSAGGGSASAVNALGQSSVGLSAPSYTATNTSAPGFIMDNGSYLCWATTTPGVCDQWMNLSSAGNLSLRVPNGLTNSLTFRSTGGAYGSPHVFLQADTQYGNNFVGVDGGSSPGQVYATSMGGQITLDADPVNPPSITSSSNLIVTAVGNLLTFGFGGTSPGVIALNATGGDGISGSIVAGTNSYYTYATKCDSRATPGNATCTQGAGIAAIAATTAAVTITDPIAVFGIAGAPFSQVNAALASTDTTCTSIRSVVVSTGSFTVNTNAACATNALMTWEIH